MLCHNLTHKHLLLRKTFRAIFSILMLLICLSFFGSYFSFARAESDRVSGDFVEWEKYYSEGLALLLEQEGNSFEDLSESQRLLDTALVLAGSDKEKQVKSLRGLAYLNCARAVAYQSKVQADINYNRRNLLYGIVILVFASILFSFLMRYGPQRPKAVEVVSGWVRKSRSKEDDSPLGGATYSFFSLVIFALAAFGILLLVLSFLWLLAFVSKPDDQTLESMKQSSIQGVHYMKRADSVSSGENDVEVNDLSLLKAYHKFLLEHGRGARAAELSPLIIKAGSGVSKRENE
jgi:predicted PurR-regulated permease PerM